MKSREFEEDFAAFLLMIQCIPLVLERKDHLTGWMSSVCVGEETGTAMEEGRGSFDWCFCELEPKQLVIVSFLR